MVTLLAVTLTLMKHSVHLNKTLALVVVADYAIVARAFLLYNKYSIMLVAIWKELI